MRLSLVRLLIQKALGALVGKYVKSPLEQDFGEAADDDIIVPEAVKYSVSPLADLVDPMAHLFATLHGLSPAKYQKLHTRMWELPEKRSARFQYQVRSHGATDLSELQIMAIKQPNNVVLVEFRSSAEVAQVIGNTVPTVEPPTGN